jgi:hypothetical protein
MQKTQFFRVFDGGAFTSTVSAFSVHDLKQGYPSYFLLSACAALIGTYIYRDKDKCFGNESGFNQVLR